MSKIIRFWATNYKKLQAVEIVPDQDGNLVVIGGRNAQGKTSILDAISAALGGVNTKDTPKPIREGEDSAEIVLETEDLVVTRRFTKSGSSLLVTTADGAKYPKGQAKLNDLIGKLSLDPLAFTQLSESKQRATLIGLVDLPFDPDELDEQRKELYDQRADVGRAGKAYGEIHVEEEYLVEERSQTDLLVEVREAASFNHGIELNQERASQLEDRIADLEQQLKEAREELEWRQVEASKEPVDVHALEEDLKDVERFNAKVREAWDQDAKRKQQDALREQYEDLSRQIQELDSRKEEGLAAAELPVEGLGFDQTGVTYNGQPFGQASAAEKLRVSMSMAIAMNPTLRVIRITDGSLLDKDNLELIRSMAEEHDAQVWIEIVGEGDGTGFIIEDGEVVE